jgi:uncharacterized protein YdaT
MLHGCTFELKDMENQFKDFDIQLKDLKPEVREKAMQIAAELVSEKGMEKDVALKAAIEEAENWFLDAEG